MLVSILGILKAGAAYVPLDADYPAARLRLMLEDSGTPLLVTQAALADRLPDHGAEMLRIDAQWDEIAQESADNPPLDLPAEASIYVMYTSGSTGRPKGIVIPHRAVSRLVFNARYMDFGPDERIAQAASVSFDAATFEIWGALLHGGTVVGIDKDVALVPRDFAAALRRERITSMFLTTALFNQIAREAPGAFNDLRNVLFGGEAADPLWVRAVLEAGPPKRLLNVYGPTESTTFATWYHVEAVPEEATTVPIGGPIGNTRVYVLDRDRVPVPVGVPGELYIGGDGLALGYLGRPELTAEHFVPDPFADDDAARLYRTGDLVRYRSDGAIEFIGRTDFQVKIRGFRIELGEIESVLTRHEAIEEAIVVVREDVPGDKRLVAYFVPAHLPAPPMRVLRQYLSEQLPAYMVPGAFVLMQELPLSPTGKIDRRALPRPERGATGDAFVAPRTPLEEELATIFGELLGLERVSVQDNFFTMGGHSLLATQLMSRVRERCGVEIPLRVLFETPTIEGLALAVNKAQSQADGPATARIDTVERGNQDLGDLLDDLLEE
jgi:amino acid adenylation domain-containing protein